MKELSEWITGDELMEKWNINQRQLFERVQDGFPAYKPCDVLEPLIIEDKFSRIGIDTSKFLSQIILINEGTISAVYLLSFLRE